MIKFNTKRKRHYDLVRLQMLIGDEATRNVTRRSIKNGVTLGFSETEIVDIVLSLKQQHFDKSITAHHSNKVWHDVYKITEKDIKLYIKLQESPVNVGVVINFKQNNERGD